MKASYITELLGNRGTFGLTREMAFPIHEYFSIARLVRTSYIAEIYLLYKTSRIGSNGF